MKYTVILLPVATVALLFSALASPPPSACAVSPCAFSTNLSWDAAGTVDSSPAGTWGTAASRSDRISFVGVPDGYAVRITRVSGDEIAGYVDSYKSGTAYVLVGLETSTPYQSPYVASGMGSEGCFVYKQAPVAPSGVRIPIDDAPSAAVLNSDNVLVIKQALFLNTTGAVVHMEATVVVEFMYVKTGKVD